MKNLFQNADQHETFMSKFEVLFERHIKGNLSSKTADLYLSILEDEGVELDIDEIINMADEYDYDLSDLADEIENLK